MNRISIQLRIALDTSARALAMGAWLAAGTALAAPVNDDFASAILLTGAGPGQTGDGLSGTQTGTNNVDATLQTGEPNPGAINTVWFKWTCPANGNLTVDTFGSTNPSAAEWDAILGIFTGAAVDALTPLDGTPKDTGDKETMTVAATAGTTYYIQFAGFGNAVAANLVVNWKLVATNGAEILAFGPGAAIGTPVFNAATITWPVFEGMPLAPTFTLSPGATCTVAGNPVVSGSTVDFSGGPVVFTVTAQGDSPIINHYTVTTVVGRVALWNIAGDGNWDTTSSNWLRQSTSLADTFKDGDGVVFNKIEGGTVNIPSTVLPGATTVGTASGDYAFSGSPIAGTGSITKSGSGTLTLASANTYSGATIVNGGTLVVNGTSAVGGSTSFTVADGAELLLSGSTTAKKRWPEKPATLAGAGTVTVPATGLIGVGFQFDMSAFTGNLNLAGGQFTVNPAVSPGFVSPVNGTINVGSGTTLYLGWTGFVLNTTVRLNSGTDNGENLGVLRASNGTLNGSLILGANSTIGADPTLIINAVISDEGNGFGFTQVANGTVTLNAAENTYTGPTIINSGATLRCNTPGALGSGDLSINGKVNLNFAGTKSIASLTLGGVPQAGGTHGSTASDATHKNDTYFVGTGTVTAPASSEKKMRTFSFGALGAATIGDSTITLEVPFGTNTTSLAPTYTVSLGATGSPASGTALNFASPQTYTITAEDLSTKAYTVTVVVGKTVLWDIAGDGDWDFSSTNWFRQPSGPITTFTNGDEAIFNNPVGGAINLTEPMLPLSTTIGTDSGDYAFSGGPIAGNGSLTMGGSGTLTLNSPNTYAGATIVNGGTLVANGTSSIGGSTSFSVANGAALHLSGSTAAKKRWPEKAATLAGAGTVTVPATGMIGVGFQFDMSAFTGNLNLAGGQFTVNPAVSPGFVSPVNGTINVGAGTTLYLGWTGFVLNTTVRLNSGTDNGENLGVLRASTATLNGAVILGTNSTIGADTTFTINASISDEGNGFGFTKVGGGTLILTAETNTYTGPTIVNSPATLQCNTPGALGGGDLRINGKLNLNYSGTKTIASLTLGGVARTAPGTYGSVASGADFTDDAYFIGTGTVTLAGNSDYDTWLTGFTFAPGANTTPTGDPDGDGMSNQEEYAFGLNPTLATSVSPIIAQFNPATGNFQYTRRATPAATKLTYKVLTSSDLATWATGGATETGFTTAGNIETVTVHVTTPAVGGKLFVRVEAVPAP